MKSIFNFNEDDGHIRVYSNDGGTVVSSNGFGYTREMNKLYKGEKYLILGGGIGWQAYHLSAVVSERDPLISEAKIVSVEKDSGMFSRTLEANSIINIRFIHDDAFDYIRNCPKFDTVFIDMFENDRHSIVFNFEDFKYLFNKSKRIVVHVVTRKDLLRYLNYGRSLKTNMLINAELFGLYSTYLTKDITVGSGGAIICFDKELEESHANSNRKLFIGFDNIYHNSTGVYPLDFVTFNYKKLGE